ncbi:hypothetical protein EYC80_004828 [Monilinia laxa]|uniref:Zn(2)-C6 fungal-type domain-containing protein n=1 Tax=Monilinia laxa TaxID=61186 RepID=A0A5N6KHZ4_MONLA|nr:hypothetical protein EYC80_004828 [Monilinia laxa]
MFLVLSPPPQEKRDSDVREQVSVPLRKRRGLPKVHSGCTTCKARRIKCDEGKPECYRCKIFFKGTSQKCGYLTRELAKPKSKEAALVTRRNILPKNVEQSEVLLRESIRSFSDIKFESARHFHYFQFFRSDVTTQVFRGFFPELWNRAVLQACHQEPCFLQAVCAIGALSRVMVARKQGRIMTINEDYRFAVQEYGKALDGMKKLIPIRMTLIATLLIFSFENFHGNHMSAVAHIQSAANLLQEWMKDREKRQIMGRYMSPAPDVIEDAVLATFHTTLIRREQEPIENDAADSAIWSKRMLDWSPAMDEFKEILTKLDQWKIAFEPLAKRVAKEDADFVTVCTMRTHWLTTRSSFLSAFIPHTPADDYQSSFEEVVKLCKTVAAHPSFEKGFVFYAGIVPSLTAASRFGAIATRREAIKVLLEIVPRREGSWDAAVSARHAIAVMKMEYEKPKQAARGNTAVVHKASTSSQPHKLYFHNFHTILLHTPSKPTSSIAKMPNWKSYEATVRLLSAIIAAHPGLKLDYAETSKYYGDESSYHQIWKRMAGIKKNSEQLRKAVEAGINPSTVTLEGGVNVMKAISVRFGGDCTVSALENRFKRLKSDAKLINAAVGNGEDPISINVADTNGQNACKSKGAISELMGSETPVGHISSQHRETWKPLSERLIAMRDAGEDCKDVDLTGLGSRRYKAEIAIKMGSDTTAGGIKTQFTRSYKVLAARQDALYAVGKDPKDASLEHLGAHKQPGDISAEVTKYMRSDVTVTGVKMQCIRHIRPLSRHQIALVATGKDPKNVLESPKSETARIMGSDTTPSSLINHFRRTVKILGNRQVSMLAAGEDSKDVSLEMLGLGQSKEIVAIMGSDVTTEAIKQQISKRIKVLGSRQTQMREAGQDPKDVDLEDLMPSKKGKGCQKFYLQHVFFKRHIQLDKLKGDSTAGGIRFQFDTRYKVIAQRQKSMLAVGKNPSTVDIETSGKGKTATAEKYGEGTTGASAKKPRAPRTPSKKSKKAASSSEEKETLNKVKGGRVEKKIVTPGRQAKTGVKNYVDSDDEGEDEDGILIKDEDINSMDFGRAVDGDDDMLGSGFGGRGHGNGRRNGGTIGEAHDEDEDRFYDDES